MNKLAGFKVLIVDDDAELRELVSEDFLMAGAQVETAASGNEALSLIRAKVFDFVLSDMRMPNGDGRFLAKEIFKIEGLKPMLFLYSGYSEIETAELNIAQVFSKPIPTTQMIDSIRRHLKINQTT